MIKEIKDLTLKEIRELCIECSTVCRQPNGKRCPLFKTTLNCCEIMNIIRSALRHNPNALEERVNIPEEME
jgi:hypothetical protein